jgi:hypothetical protein
MIDGYESPMSCVPECIPDFGCSKHQAYPKWQEWKRVEGEKIQSRKECLGLCADCKKNLSDTNKVLVKCGNFSNEVDYRHGIKMSSLADGPTWRSIFPIKDCLDYVPKTDQQG